jgi:hypothetical protein
MLDNEGYIQSQVAYMPSSIKKQFIHKLKEVCLENCIKLNENYNIKQYKSNFSTHDNLITWGVKMPQRWYNGKKKNVLYCENGLLSQHEGIYVDSEGWFGDSSIVKFNEYEEDICQLEDERIEEIAQRWLKFPVFFGSYDPKGPILIALQRQNDAPVKYHYWHSDRRKENSILSVMRIVSSFFKDREVIVRPHPKHLNDWYKIEGLAKEYFGDKWYVDDRTHTNMSVYERIKMCSKVITINSTVATEALYSGIPVATLGGGSFNSSGATLECAWDLNKLNDLDDFIPDMDKIRKYLAAVLRHQVAYGCDLDAIRTNKYIREWIERCWESVEY